MNSYFCNDQNYFNRLVHWLVKSYFDRHSTQIVAIANAPTQQGNNVHNQTKRTT